MNIAKLKDYIIDNPDLIEVILEDAGFHHINGNFANGLEFRCGWSEDSSGTGIKVSTETLSSTYFKTGLSGDLITLVQAKTEESLPVTLKRIAKLVGYVDDGESYEIEYAFSGLFKELEQLQEFGEIIDVKTYDESVLDEYLIMPSLRFMKDGISWDVQNEYKIGYDSYTDRILVPWRDVSGNLIGIMGRLNKDEIEDWEAKWLPLINFPKSQALFGFSHNYNQMLNHSMVIVAESEKSPMKLNSQGCHLGVAIGGSNLSSYQANQINSMFPKKIIIAMDEGLEEEKSVNILEKLKYDTYYSNDVTYLYDDNNLFLPKDSKMSPCDLPIADFKRMIKHCSKTI